MILKAGEHQITLTNEALEERESGVLHRSGWALFQMELWGEPWHIHTSHRRGGRQAGGVCSRLRVCRPAPQPDSRSTKKTGRALLHWDFQGCLDLLKPLTRPSRTCTPLLLIHRHTATGLQAFPCHSASSKTGQDPSVLQSQTTHLSSRLTLRVSACFPEKP